MNPTRVFSFSRRALGFAFAAVAVVAGSALLTVFLFDPSQHGFYPKCLLHSLTGWNCAGCGSLRATHHLLHGEWLQAFRCNALLVLALGVPVVLGVRWWRGEPPAAVLARWFTPTIVLVLVGITLAFSVLRNLPVAAFAWLNP